MNRKLHVLYFYSTVIPISLSVSLHCDVAINSDYDVLCVSVKVIGIIRNMSVILLNIPLKNY